MFINSRNLFKSAATILIISALISCGSFETRKELEGDQNTDYSNYIVKAKPGKVVAVSDLPVARFPLSAASERCSTIVNFLDSFYSQYLTGIEMVYEKDDSGAVCLISSAEEKTDSYLVGFTFSRFGAELNFELNVTADGNDYISYSLLRILEDGSKIKWLPANEENILHVNMSHFEPTLRSWLL